MRCALCRKRGCKPWERNTDGTYAHSECLYATSLVVIGKGPKGGHLFGQKVTTELPASQQERRQA